MDELNQQSTYTQPSYDTVTKPKKKDSHFLGGFAVGFVTMLIIAIISIIYLASKISFLQLFTSSNLTSTQKKLESIEDYLKLTYLEDIDEKAWSEGILHGAVKSLGDPYTEYYTPEEFKEFMVSSSGEYGGIGAQLQKDPETGLVSITRIYANTPAEIYGLQEGDIILSADEYSCLDEELDDFIQHIRGENGSKVTLSIIRDSNELQIDVVRAQINLPSIEYEMLDNNNGYIIIGQFTDHTDEDFIAACDDLLVQGADSFIIDLRDNGGGIVESCEHMLDYLLPEGLIVYTDDKYGNRVNSFSDAENYIDVPIVLLVNGNTASSSEIFAGAIRDFNYGTLIGTNTFGKGIVQSIYQFADGSGIKVTTHYYYTPSGECIHKKGIAPDIELEYIRPEGSYSKETDNQLIYAQEYLEKNY